MFELDISNLFRYLVFLNYSNNFQVLGFTFGEKLR
jgi:hypothetical protein